ncbi:MAG: two-component system sensor protein [Acidobacteria bacterium]|nr:two-component system sensor protein [Acidobacteriota bacterium]
MLVAPGRAAAVAIMLLWSAIRADALDPRKAINEYSHTTWNQREGLPWGPIYALAQTRDGYLWLPSATGLLRFDGSRFTRWQPVGAEVIPGAYATALHTAQDGSLWVGFIDGRISRIRDGHVVNYATLVSRRVRTILDTPDGAVWVSYDPSGLSLFREGVWRHMRNDDGNETADHCLFQDSRHRVWTCAHGAAVWRPQQQRFAPVGLSIDIWSLAEDTHGRIVGISIDGSMSVVDGAPTNLYDNVRGLPLPRTIEVDHQGNVWIVTAENGLYRIRNNHLPGPAPLEHFGKPQGLSSDAVLSFHEDRDGNVWIGTSNGLNRFRESKLRSISALTTRTSVLGLAVTATPDGSVWVGTARGLTRFETDGDRHVERETVLADRLVLSLRYDIADDALWVGTSKGLFVLTPHRSLLPRVLPVPTLEYPRAIARDREGPFWFADSARGVIRWDPADPTAPVEVERGSGAFIDFVDRQHRVWIGYDDGHVRRFSGGRARVYASSEGLSGAPVKAFHEDRFGTLWVGTDRGLSRLDGDRFTTFTVAQGLPADFVSEIVEDDTGMFWLGTGAGIARIDPREFEKSTADPMHRIEHTLYDGSDGLRGMPAHFGNPGATRTRDGRLWFLTQNGIAIVDATPMGERRPPPPVHIERISANDRAMDLSTTVELPPRTNTVTVDYTAPDLSVPEKVRFKYRLEGLDDAWRDVGSRRQAFYNSLRPGTYRFRVIACNGDGVWNETGAAVQLRVLPAFYQTRWFRALSTCALLLTGWGAHRARLWQIARRLRAQFETRMAERERIAAQLHDTLIQDLAALSLQAEIVDDQLPQEPDAAKDTLVVLRTGMQRVVTDGRRGLTELHAGVIGSDELADALTRAAQELRGSNGPSFHVVVEGHTRALHPLVGDEVYRIAREAIANAFRHAAAHRIQIEVSLTSDELRVRVQDDGHGIAEQVVQAGRPGHFGLEGMRTRAAHIGASLKVWSRVDVGTEVALIVPARSAFQPPYE